MDKHSQSSNAQWWLFALITMMTLGLNPQPAMAQTVEPNPIYRMGPIRWEPAGERILFSGQDSNREWQVWVYDDGLQSVAIPSLESVPSLFWSPNGDYFSVGRHIVNADTLRIERTLQSVSGIGGWSADGTEVIAWEISDRLGFYDPKTGELLRTISFEDTLPDVIGSSPDGTRFVAAQPTGGVQIISAQDHSHIIDLVDIDYPISLQWSPDSRYLAGSFIESVDAGTPNTLPFAVNPTLASLAIWDATTGEVVHRYDGLPATALAVRWHPEGHEVAAAAGQNFVFLWDLCSPEQIEQIVPTGLITGIEYSPFGGRLAIGRRTDASVTRSQAPTTIPQSIIDKTLVYIVPVPSHERLGAILAACERDADAPIALPAASAQIDLNALIAQLEALPDAVIPPACRADAVAVARAIQNR